MPECEFEVDSLSTEEQPIIYQRDEWVSEEGEKYYSWQEKDVPNLITCKKILWSEARRRKLISTSSSEIVYHYTDIKGFIGILSSGSIRLTDYSYLNDRREIEHGVDIFRSVAEEMLRKSENDVINELLKSWIRNSQDINNNVYIASFSADGDSLSQWRAYGTIAIGFQASKIAQHVNHGTIQSVEYGQRSQFELVSLYMNHLCQSYLKDISVKSPYYISETYQRTQMIELISFFKDSSFQDEREYRAVFIEDKNQNVFRHLKKIKKHFNPSSRHIKPYVNSSEIYPLPGHGNSLEIAEIVLGPSSDEMLERGVHEFLLEHGVNNIPIRQSRVPYRT